MAQVWWVLTLIFLCSAGAFAQAGPQPPCGHEAVPPHPSLSTPPTVMFWKQATVGRAWVPPACTGWTAEGFSTLVTTVARFQGPWQTEGLLRRIGAISQLSGMRYWSTTHQRWQTLIVDAHALSGPQGDRRNDFSPEEMQQGAVLYFEQLDNLSGKAVYRMHIQEATEKRIVFDVENITALRYFLLTLFHPGELQSIYFLDRDSPDVWRYYGMLRTGKNANSLTAGKEASSINRSVAFFRHLAGIPDNLEPPAAR